MSVQANATHNIMELNDDERQLCEVWCRVMGYYQVTTNYNIGKRQEFNERKWYKEGDL